MEELNGARYVETVNVYEKDKKVNNCLDEIPIGVIAWYGGDRLEFLSADEDVTASFTTHERMNNLEQAKHMIHLYSIGIRSHYYDYDKNSIF